ncbi:MAG: hypothetical protein JXK07_09535 [Spirochaetes bacterium]|nr:hypothetical protein [Spirochaetota bacterium]MBN2770416.1 hypothetical protein [Spirochaetota bacterium]
MITRLLSFDPDVKQFTVIGLGPGFVKTDMTKDSTDQAIGNVEDNVPLMIKTIENVTKKDSGSLFEFNGRKLRVEVDY